jgi:molybdate transport system substrate-binding protein
VKVLSSLAIKAAYLELVPQFEKSAGHKVRTEWVGMADIRKRVKAGENADVIIGSRSLVEELIEAGKLAKGSALDLVKSGVGAAVRHGAPKPDISSVEAVKRAMRAAKSVVYSSGPSGVYLAQLFQRWGLADELKGRLTQTPPGVLVGELVARGEMELAFQQVPELQQVSGIDYIGPLPADIQLVTVFTGGVHSAARDPDACKALLQFLHSPAAAPVMKQHGMDLA